MRDVEKETFFIREKAISLSYSAKSLKARSEEESSGYGVRVLSDGCLGFAFASGPEGAEAQRLEEAERKALAAAKYSPRPNFGFAEKSGLPSVDAFDRELAGIDAPALKEIFEQVREGAEKYGGEAQIEVSAGWAEERLENTNGFSGSFRSSSISFLVEVMDGDGYGFYGNSFCRLRDAGDFYKIGEEAAAMARMMRNPKKPEGGNHTVIFEPQALDALFDILLPSFNGDLKRRKISFLHDRLGEKAFSGKFSLYDDPLLAGSPYSAPFDGDGLAGRRKALVEYGTVKNFSYNLEIASLEGVGSSGFATRASYASPPSIGFSNIVVAPGSLAEDENDKALRVLSFHGSHTANITTGDFGVEVNAAFYGGEVPVRGFMITANIFNLFNDIYGLGKKQARINGLLSPRIAFSGVRVLPA